MGDERRVDPAEGRPGVLDGRLAGVEPGEICLGGALGLAPGGGPGQLLWITAHQVQPIAAATVEPRDLLGDGGGRTQNQDSSHAPLATRFLPPRHPTSGRLQKPILRMTKRGSERITSITSAQIAGA